MSERVVVPRKKLADGLSILIESFENLTEWKPSAMSKFLSDGMPASVT